MFDGGEFLKDFFEKNRAALGRTMRLLSEELEVRPALIAAGFETNVDNIRQIRKRSKSTIRLAGASRKPAMTLEPMLGEQHARPDLARKKALKIAWETDGNEVLVEPNNYFALQDKIESICEESITRNSYAEGAAKLKRIRDQVGRPGQIDRRRQFADLLRKRAFLLISCGMCTSGISDAQYAAWLFYDIFRDSREMNDLKEVVNCGLLIGNGYNLRAEPDKTHETLELLESIWHALGPNEKPNGDFYRLQGVANFQQMRLPEAMQSFEKSMAQLEKSGKMRGTADWLHHGVRHIEILKNIKHRRPQAMEDLLQTVRQSFGSDSLHGSVSTQWAAATWLSLGSSDADRLARREIKNNWHLSSRFGHQKTLSALLWLIPDFGLELWARQKLVRWALYENINRDK